MLPAIIGWSLLTSVRGYLAGGAELNTRQTAGRLHVVEPTLFLPKP